MKNMSAIIKCGLKFDLNRFDSFLMGSNLKKVVVAIHLEAEKKRIIKLIIINKFE